MSDEAYANMFSISIGHDKGEPDKGFAAVVRNDEKYLDLIVVDLLIDLKAVNTKAYDALMVLAQEFTDGWEDA